MGRNVREAGNNYERKIVNELKELGYSDVVTSRSESKSMDNKKIDIFGESFPYYVQCKLTQNNPSYHDIIANCEDKRKPLVIFHNKTEQKKKNVVSVGEYVILEKDLFYKLITNNVESIENNIREDLFQKMINYIKNYGNL